MLARWTIGDSRKRVARASAYCACIETREMLDMNAIQAMGKGCSDSGLCPDELHREQELSLTIMNAIFVATVFHFLALSV